MVLPVEVAAIEIAGELTYCQLCRGDGGTGFYRFPVLGTAEAER